MAKNSMTVIDNTGKPSETKFGDLELGEAFIDEDGDINIKVSCERAMYYAEGHWDTIGCSMHTTVIPLAVTYTFDRRE